MSGIGGIFNFNTPFGDENALLALGEALISRGPDGGRNVHRGPVGMAHRAFHTNRESRLESQPFTTRFGQMLALDGRLDNRDDLLTYFPRGFEDDRTDVALVMAAYLKWGTEFLPKLIGDFALSLYDERSNILLLARDPFGTRTLYYSANEERVFWSSTLAALLVAAVIEPQVDDEYVAGYLALHPAMSVTPYRNVSAVEPGHVVVTRNGHLKAQRFWKPESNDEIRYQTDSEYEEHFRQLYREAVRCRLRADGPVWLELSGGLDSSSNVCMADQIMAEGEVPATRIETVSYIDSESSTSYDRNFIRLIEEKRGRTGHHLHGLGHWVRFVSPEESFISKPSTALCVAGGHARRCELMEADGARVLLSGLGGDQVLWSTPEPSPALTDLVFQYRPLQLHRQLQVWSNVVKKPYLQVLCHEALLPFLPTRVRAAFQTRLEAAPWLTHRFVKRLKYKERLLLPDDPFGYRLPSRRMQSSMIGFITSGISAGEWWEDSRFDKTYPFLHRPLVEFLMAIPFDQKLRPGETRSLMRRALRDVLPEKIRRRKSKGVTGETVCRGLAKEWPALKPMLVNARVCSRGYVDHAAFMLAIELARHGKLYNISTLLKTISLEIWLRSLEFHHGLESRVGLSPKQHTQESAAVSALLPATR